MAGQSECVYPDNGVEDGIHPSPRQDSNPRFLYRVVGPMNFRWCNRVVSYKLRLIVKLTGTAVCKTTTFFGDVRFVFGVSCHVTTYSVSLDIHVRGKWERQMSASVRLRAPVSAWCPLCLCLIRQGSVSCCKCHSVT